MQWRIRFIPSDINSGGIVGENYTRLIRQRMKISKERKKLFELKKFKITQITKTMSLGSSATEHTPKVSFKSVMSSFDYESSDIFLIFDLVPDACQKSRFRQKWMNDAIVILDVDEHCRNDHSGTWISIREFWICEDVIR